MVVDKLEFCIYMFCNHFDRVPFHVCSLMCMIQTDKAVDYMHKLCNRLHPICVLLDKKYWYKMLDMIPDHICNVCNHQLQYRQSSL